MSGEEFLEWVAGSNWRIAKSSPHQYTIRFWHGDRGAFETAVRHAHQNGTPGQWNGETFYYYRPGDGFRYWSYWNGDMAKLREIVCFNRAAEDVGQLRFPV